jgi:hypothetical protein
MPDLAPQSVLQELAAFHQLRTTDRGGLVGEGRVGHGVRGALDPVRFQGPRRGPIHEGEFDSGGM